MKKIFLLGALMILHFVTFAQEEITDVETEEKEGKHSLTFALGHSRIGQGRSESGEKEFIMVPSFGLGYNYWISQKFALGLHTDFLNEVFFIETESGGDLIERERPIAPAVMGTLKPGKNWGIGFGFGGEFVNGGETYFVTRLTIEYGTVIRKGWEFGGVLSQDFRASAYNVTSFGIGIGKRF